ncbi:hypothetical protein BZA77DRAFT_387027 [Pyronema omphalodes]|nr:hypothetical protein BZA77DRAFT_387027 [Pyronema omphalodes]
MPFLFERFFQKRPLAALIIRHGLGPFKALAWGSLFCAALSVIGQGRKPPPSDYAGFLVISKIFKIPWAGSLQRIYSGPASIQLRQTSPVLDFDLQGLYHGGTFKIQHSSDLNHTSLDLTSKTQPLSTIVNTLQRPTIISTMLSFFKRFLFKPFFCEAYFDKFPIEAFIIRHGLKPAKFLVWGTVIAGGLNLIGDFRGTPSPDDVEYKIIKKLFKIPVVRDGPYVVPTIR